MPDPKPVQPEPNTHTGRPIMALLDLLGRRWALRILWELLQNAPSSFRVLQQQCGNISPTVLNKRLMELRRAEIVELHDGKGYALTEEGLSLCRSLSSLRLWANQWGERLTQKKKLHKGV